MKFLLIVAGAFLVGYFLGDFTGYTRGLQIAEAIQWAN